VNLAGGAAIDVEMIGSGRWRLTSPGGQPVILGVPADRLELDGDRDALISGFDGLTVVPSIYSGDLQLAYPTPLGRRLGQAIQLVVVASGAILAQTRRDGQSLEVAE
jgi:hypothetical protein